MKTGDNHQRTKAIPYYGQILGYNRSAQSDQDISQTVTNYSGGSSGPSVLGQGDLSPIIQATPQKDYMIRILRPKFGQIVQAYLNIGITFAASETNPKFRVSVGGPFSGDNFTPVVPSDAFITQCMNVISPSSNFFVGTAGNPITFYKINIQSLIPQVGATNYVADFYTVGLHFVTAPVMTGTFHLTKFFITGSILVV